VLLPWDVVLEGRRQELDAFAVTNHNRIGSAQLVHWVSQRLDGPIVLVGEEVSTLYYHLSAVGLDRVVPPDGPAALAIARIHEQGGVAIAAHPTRGFWQGYDEAALRSLDGAEVVHPVIVPRPWTAEELRAFYRRAEAAAAATGRQLAAVGSSDFHVLGTPGQCRTAVFVRERSERGILEALRAGRTVAYDVHGRAFGDPALVRALNEAPVPAVQGPPSRHRGLLGVAAAAIGWLGLLGLVVLG
jgi:hypothetical protein